MSFRTSGDISIFNVEAEREQSLLRQVDDLFCQLEELDPLKLPELLQLKYGGVNDALKEIGTSADGVRNAFFDFQKFLYEESAA
jgi:hypothetical protein